MGAIESCTSSGSCIPEQNVLITSALDCPIRENSCPWEDQRGQAEHVLGKDQCSLYSSP